MINILRTIYLYMQYVIWTGWKRKQRHFFCPATSVSFPVGKAGRESHRAFELEFEVSVAPFSSRGFTHNPILLNGILMKYRKI